MTQNVVRAVLVAPPLYWPRPGEVWSLWDMIELALGDLLDSNISVARAVQALQTLEQIGVSKHRTLGVEMLRDLMQAAEDIAKFAKEADLDATEAAADRLHAHISAWRGRHVGTGQKLDVADAEINALQAFVTQLGVSFSDQMRARFALVLTKQEERLFACHEPPFGPDVFVKFSDSARDLVEASKCLALHRNTASVFHLMLAMERAMRLLADRIGANLYNAKGNFEKWSVLVSRIKEKIPVQPADMQDAWTDAHNLFWGVGKVWRNDTMHPADAYTDAEATEVYGAVRVFMQRLAPLI